MIFVIPIILGAAAIASAAFGGVKVVEGVGNMNEAKVNTEIATIEAAQEFLQQVEQQIRELGQLVHKLERRAGIALDELESRPFDRHREASKFQQVALLVKALAEIIKTPVLNSQGNLNPATATIKAKYRTLEGN